MDNFKVNLNHKEKKKEEESPIGLNGCLNIVICPSLPNLFVFTIYFDQDRDCMGSSCSGQQEQTSILADYLEI